MAGDGAQVRTGRTVTAMIASVLLAGASAMWVTSNLAVLITPAWVGWIPPMLSSPLVVAMSIVAATTPGVSEPARRFWQHIAVAFCLVTLGLVSNVADASSGPDAPTQKVSILTLGLYLIGATIGLIALLRTPAAKASGSSDGSRFWLDSIIVAATTGLFAWHLCIRGLGRPFADPSSGSVAIGTILLAAVLILALSKVALTGPPAIHPVSMNLLALGAAVGGAGAALFPLVHGHPYLNGAQFVLPLTAVSVVGAAHRQRMEPAVLPEPAQRGRVLSVVPLLAVFAADLLLLATRDGSTEATVVALFTVALTLAVIGRQVLAFHDNERLLREVDAGVARLRATQSELVHQASHDALTGLANRQLFETELRTTLDGEGQVSVALVDLDDFKAINDRLGHTTGDEVLKVVAQRLTGCVKDTDLVARLGGDEFALLLRNVADSTVVSILDRVTEVLARPVGVHNHELSIGSSIGVADSWPEAEPTELLRRADLAMYAAKGTGKGRRASYAPDLDLRAEADAELVAGLRRGLRRGEFYLLFQPIVGLPEGTPLGAEALVRWRHPEHGTVAPDVFIPVAERSGLITELGAWILREACTAAAQWLETSAELTWHIGVNISARQLREPGFASVVEECLEHSGLPAERLVIEVTETAVFDNARAVEQLAAIVELGATVALDDFGTGHSSLGLLRTCPVGLLKVDKSFVDSITTSTEEAVIATAMIRIADGLHLNAVAEGVETEAQARRLHELGYRMAQGYHFSRPMPAALVGRMLARAAENRVAEARLGDPRTPWLHEVTPDLEEVAELR